MLLNRGVALSIVALAGMGLSGSIFGGPPHEDRSCDSASPTATTQPSTVEWDKSAKGVKVKFPGDWKVVKNPDYELMLLPPGGKKDDRRITIDIPDLPPHFAFMIRMSRVEHDYLEDLKKEHPDLQVQAASDANLAGSTARLIQSTWHANKQTYDDVVLLVIHDSSVYIFDAETDEPDLTATRAVFDSIRASIQWVKK